MATINAYRSTITKAYSISEIGSGYSLTPWGHNTPYYEGYSEPVIIETGLRLAESNSGAVYLYGATGGGYTLNEAIALGLAQVVG